MTQAAFSRTNKTAPQRDDYSDIINLPRPVSKTHPQMSKATRAAQFAPYAALVGHRDIIASKEQVAFTKNDIDREIIIELDPEVAESDPEIAEDFATDPSMDTLDDFTPFTSQENPLDS